MLINKYSVLNSNLFYLLHMLLWLSPIDGNHRNITIYPSTPSGSRVFQIQLIVRYFPLNVMQVCNLNMCNTEFLVASTSFTHLQNCGSEDIPV